MQINKYNKATVGILTILITEILNLLLSESGINISPAVRTSIVAALTGFAVWYIPNKKEEKTFELEKSEDKSIIEE